MKKEKIILNIASFFLTIGSILAMKATPQFNNRVHLLGTFLTAEEQNMECLQVTCWSVGIGNHVGEVCRTSNAVGARGTETLYTSRTIFGRHCQHIYTEAVARVQ